jgi:pimeloyl-ACP methyl ester carboxylesterase
MRSPLRLLSLAAIALPLAACSTSAPVFSRSAPPVSRAAAELRQARRAALPVETRAGLYLDAAALAAPHTADPKAQAIYNDAAGELTALLRSADGGRLWNRPLTLSANSATYRLRFQPGARDGGWSPDEFTAFTPAREVRRRHLRRSVTESGLGGALVGVRKKPGAGPDGRAPFQPKPGFVAPVTATLDFRGRDAVLTLSDPAERRTARVLGRSTQLAADFTAPIAFHPMRNELWLGLMGLIQVEKYLGKTGLYMLHPYDPDRIPVILVHGLLSTPQMWVNVINEVEADPRLRGRFQFWVFRYPTGNPLSYSAMRCREELAKMQQLHPMPRGFIMVGHSMGGLVSRMQATDSGRALWEANLGAKAAALDAKLPPDDLVRRLLVFDANPQVQRLVFICVPHRGSGLALGSIGAIAMRLITLPTSLVTEVTAALGDVLLTASGQKRVPNSITSLSPKNPTLIAMDRLPIRAPHHSIIGDRGKANTPRSSDGVVPYRSSHLASAESELIVTGPHGSHDLPPTIAELTRILREHLRQTRR